MMVKKEVCARVPTAVGEFQLCLYTNNQDHKEHLAFIKGDIYGKSRILTRIHSECFTGDVLGSRRCDCGEQLHLSMLKIAQEGTGLILYLRQEGRGIGLLNKLRAYNLQDQGLDTVDANLSLGHEADERDYRIAAEILNDLIVKSIRILTNNPAKILELTRLGIIIEDRVPLVPTFNPDNEYYMMTKINRMNHQLELETAPYILSNAHGNYPK